MSNSLKKALSLVLALIMVLSLAACGGSKTETPATASTTTAAPAATAEPTATPEPLAADVYPELFDIDKYDDTSAGIYEDVLGEFAAMFAEAKEYVKPEDLSMRYALMALSEGKLMEAAVMLPTTTRGGMYAISRVVPYSISPVLWGDDSDRFHNALVTTEPIKSADRDELRTMYAELIGTGTYVAEAKKFLEDKGYEFKDSYSLAYTSDPVTWDILSTSRQADAENIVHTYDGLMEYDSENILQPALAESYEVSEDGTVYTFHLRKGVVWTDSQGRKVADVKADDFVAGMQHMMDAAGGLEYLVCSQDDGGCGLKGASAYVGGETADFEEVGVKALDDYTVEYTLDAECPYFMTMLGYSVFAPMSRDYYVSQGGGFGQDYNPEAETYKYGKDADSIAYCGPYLVTNVTSESTIAFSASPAYWNKDNITIKNITMLFNDGSDVKKAYEDMKAGVVDGCNLNTSTIPIAKEEGLFDEFSYVSLTDATSFMAFFNVNRTAFANASDTTTVISSQLVSDAERTKAAMGSNNFRLALAMAVDRAAFNATQTGEDLKLNSLRNSYTPGNFVSLSDEVTVDINGTATTFPAGTFYGEIMQAQIDADGIPLKVWDGETLSGDGFDGWYNPEEANKYLDAAIEELGIEISVENPIYIDLPVPTNSEIYVNQKNVFKQSVEAALGGKVIVNLTECVDYNEWYYAGYYTDYGYEANYDVYDLSGWGPDYGDPATYLNTFLSNYSGYMIKCIGIY